MLTTLVVYTVAGRDSFPLVANTGTETQTPGGILVFLALRWMPLPSWLSLHHAPAMQRRQDLSWPGEDFDTGGGASSQAVDIGIVSGHELGGLSGPCGSGEDMSGLG
jgi:hypothetical protein